MNKYEKSKLARGFYDILNSVADIKPEMGLT